LNVTRKEPENNMRRIWQASYARGIRLSNAGCQLPYLHALPGKEVFHQRALHVNQLNGYFESYAIDFGTSTGYVIALRVSTDRTRGAIVIRRDLLLPWPDHEIEWGYDPQDLLPKDRVKEYGKLVKSRLQTVLDERRLLSRGRPVDGLLCGRAWTPIPTTCPRDRPAMAEIILVEDSGVSARSSVQLTIRGSVRRTCFEGRVRKAA